MIGAELSGDAGRTWITLPMDDQCGDPQGGKLFRHGTLLGEVVRIVAKQPIDLEIDVKTVDEQLPSQFPRVWAVSDVSGPR